MVVASSDDAATIGCGLGGDGLPFGEFSDSVIRPRDSTTVSLRAVRAPPPMIKLGGRCRGDVLAAGPGFSVRYYRCGDEHAIVRLFERAFGLRRDLAVWRWLYDQPPLGRRVVVAEADDGDIVAHYAAIPLWMTVEGREVIGNHCVDSMVDPSMRRGLAHEGPFLRTARCFFEHLGDPAPSYLNYGFPNRAAYRVGTNHLEYLTTFRPIPALFHNLYDGSPAPSLGVASGYEMRRIERCGGDVDDLWRRLAPTYGFALRRDAAYLNWRHADCPVPHELFEVRHHGSLRAVVALRAGWSSASILAITDWLGGLDDRDALRAVLGHALERAREERLERVELWLPERSPLFAACRSLGFSVEASPFTMVCRLPRTPGQLAWHRDRWFYTIGDSDVL